MNLWLENPNFFQFLLKNKLHIASIMTLDRASFNLLSGQTQRLETVLALNISFDSLVKLSFDDLCMLLVGRPDERQELGTEFIVS